jgi:hypothetical protein
MLVGPDAMAERWKEVMRVADLADLRCCRPDFAGKHVNADIFQELMRQDVVPQGRRMYPDGKYIFMQIQRLSSPQKLLSSCCQNSARLELARLCYPARFAGKIQRSLTQI